MELADAGVASAKSPAAPASPSPQGEKGGEYQDRTVADVLQWLTDSRITEPSVHKAFKQHHVDGEVLFYLTEKELMNIVPVSSNFNFTTRAPILAYSHTRILTPPTSLVALAALCPSRNPPPPPYTKLPPQSEHGHAHEVFNCAAQAR